MLASGPSQVNNGAHGRTHRLCHIADGKRTVRNLLRGKARTNCRSDRHHRITPVRGHSTDGASSLGRRFGRNLRHRFRDAAIIWCHFVDEQSLLANLGYRSSTPHGNRPYWATVAPRPYCHSLCGKRTAMELVHPAAADPGNRKAPARAIAHDPTRLAAPGQSIRLTR